MFGLFKKNKLNNKAFDPSLYRQVTIEKMKNFLVGEANLPESAVEAMHVSMLIRNYVVIMTLGIYDQAKGRKPGDPVPSLDRIAIMVVGVQCAHMLWRIVHAGQDLNLPKLLETKDVMMQNIGSGLVECDHNNPTDVDLGIMARGVAIYWNIADKDNQLLQNIDRSWDLLFTVPNKDAFALMAGWIDRVVEYQET